MGFFSGFVLGFFSFFKYSMDNFVCFLFILYGFFSYFFLFSLFYFLSLVILLAVF